MSHYNLRPIEIRRNAGRVAASASLNNSLMGSFQSALVLGSLDSLRRAGLLLRNEDESSSSSSWTFGGSGRNKHPREGRTPSSFGSSHSYNSPNSSDSRERFARSTDDKWPHGPGSSDSYVSTVALILIHLLYSVVTNLQTVLI